VEVKTNGKHLPNLINIQNGKNAHKMHNFAIKLIIETKKLNKLTNLLLVVISVTIFLSLI
jgi:hypothetical protein